MSFWGIGIGAAVAIGTAVATTDAQRKAAHAQSDAANKALELTSAEYQQTREDYLPWLTEGKEALNKLSGMVEAGPGEYEKSPYYNMLLEEGTRGLERGAAAKGKLFSGEEAKALTKYGEGLASMDYNTWLDNWYKSLTPLQSLANLGMTATGQQASLGNVATQQMGQNVLAGGQAEAGGQLGVANTYANALNSIRFNSLYNQPGATPTTPTSTLYNNAGGNAMYNQLYGDNSSQRVPLKLGL